MIRKLLSILEGQKKSIQVNACLKQENLFQDFYINLESNYKKKKEGKKVSQDRNIAFLRRKNIF